MCSSTSSKVICWTSDDRLLAAHQLTWRRTLPACFRRWLWWGRGAKGKAAKARGRSARLQALDDRLAALHSSNLPCSFNQFKAYINSQGICLAKCRAYGSQAALRTQLQQQPNLAVYRGEAKKLNMSSSAWWWCGDVALPLRPCLSDTLCSCQEHRASGSASRLLWSSALRPPAKSVHCS